MESLITKTEALSILGITSHKFNTLKIQPAKTKRNPYNGGLLVYLYHRDDILKLKDTKQVKELQPKVYSPKDYAALFAKRYASKEDALPDACYALFNLNRYAKHASCTMANREEIYSLKSDFIEYLYFHDYCTHVELHTQSGYKESRFNKYTAEYEEEYDWENNFYSFTFDIYGTAYNWHQPEEKVKFTINCISQAKEIGNIEKHKPISMRLAKLKEAKELIRWLVNNSY